jgi:hypothetical protein
LVLFVIRPVIVNSPARISLIKGILVWRNYASEGLLPSSREPRQNRVAMEAQALTWE